MGNRVRLYAPVGEMLPGMAYLVRRLLENTSNSGFLKISHHDKVDVARLMSAPKPGSNGAATAKVPLHGKKMRVGDLRSPFENCPLTDFTLRANQQAFAAAIDRVRRSLPRTAPAFVEGHELQGRPLFDRECPSETSLIVAKVAHANAADADRAAKVAYAAYPAWRDASMQERGLLLEKLADLMEADRFELAAVMAFEEGKPWREADADVAEAIDFCRYYARQALIELAPRKQGDVPGEDNVMLYEGRGPTVIISPWNFPLAILCGMTTAALAAGNPVIMKPAGQSSLIAYELYKRMIAAGFDPRVVQFLPGSGSEVGSALVDHPLIAGIAFTGSMEVGLRIYERAAKVHPGQPLVKRVVCEMGGKNAIIIDDDADLDEAVVGVLKSAFGYAGQKCSACSRVVTVGPVHEAFVARLIEGCRSIDVAPAHDPHCQMGPVIDRASQERLLGVIRNPGPDVKPLFVGEVPQGGHFVPPAVFEVKDTSHALMCNELFGPVIALMRAESFDRALEVANACAFKLTGAVYSRSPVNLELARQKFRVGNLYLNRGSTGAMVHRQPFGGFGMSGGGTKAGGPGYLLNFVDPRVVTENTMRRGMTPELTE
jgi:RHH-type proline utilization regulon transcriptional repressor/proline dehydrogenase/delta 1-pyrroline-5-carboxylate dehydrogenase